MFILDTSVLSALRRPERRPQVADWLRRQREGSLFMSAVTLGEVQRGISQQRATEPDFAAAIEASIDLTELQFAERIPPFGSAEARV